MVQLVENIVRPSFSVVLNVMLICRQVWFFENFTLCELNNFDVILKGKWHTPKLLDRLQKDSKAENRGKVRIRSMLPGS
jgi:hypothetical protein